MTNKLHIREATSDDLESLLDLYKHLIANDETCPIIVARKSFASFLQYSGSAILLGEVGNSMVTSCAVVMIPNLTRGGAPYALIENVVTHSDHRGKGYGRLILETATKLAWENSCYKVMLMTGSNKPETHAFYERAGFEQSKTGF